MKNIIICCDGTGNEYGTNNTNLVQTCEVAVRSDEQIVYYDPGVGTGGWEYNEESGILRSTSDAATGYGLQKNVTDAYIFLMNEFEAGDNVYLFGFSRGAFTVRSLGGMLYKCGLLSQNNENLVEYAAKLYNTKDNKEIAAGFKKTFSRPCPVHFIGVWDTVESLILNAGKKFHDAKLNPEVSNGYHALAIDERRKDFLPFPWDEDNLAPNQIIEQVWFAGVHSDVGGWYKERGLSNIAFQWMMKAAIKCGMKVHINELKKYTENPFDELHNSYKGLWKIKRRVTRNIKEGSKIHKSVIDRMNNPGLKYKPAYLPKNYTVIE